MGEGNWEWENEWRQPDGEEFEYSELEKKSHLGSNETNDVSEGISRLVDGVFLGDIVLVGTEPISGSSLPLERSNVHIFSRTDSEYRLEASFHVESLTSLALFRLEKNDIYQTISSFSDEDRVLSDLSSAMCVCSGSLDGIFSCYSLSGQLLFSQKWFDGPIKRIKQVLPNNGNINVDFGDLWICYDRYLIVLDIEKFIIELDLSFTSEISHELHLEKIAHTYMSPYLPPNSTIHDLCPIGFIKNRDSDPINCHILITSDQGDFFMYHMDSSVSTISDNISSNVSQMIGSGDQMTSKLTSLIVSFARTVINNEYRSFSRNSRGLKEADWTNIKPLLIWKDLGRNYLDIVAGVNYTILTDSLGDYSLFDNFDGLFIRKIKEDGTSKPILVVGEPELLAIFRPQENYLCYLLMPFGTEIRRMRLELKNQQFLLRILVTEQGQDIAIILDFTSPGRPKLLRCKLIEEKFGI